MIRLTSEISAMIDLVRPSLVGVAGRNGFGSGVVWGPNLIITNDHVAQSDRPVILLTGDEELQGRVIARDLRNDLAAIDVEVSLSPLTVRTSDNLRVGELVVAVGHPLGLKDAPALGMISGLGNASWMGRIDRDLIQVDVSLAPGNSGGPILDMNAQVVGIACMIANPGLALVIPSRVVQRFVAQIDRRRKNAA